MSDPRTGKDPLQENPLLHQQDDRQPPFPFDFSFLPKLDHLLPDSPLFFTQQQQQQGSPQHSSPHTQPSPSLPPSNTALHDHSMETLSTLTPSSAQALLASEFNQASSSENHQSIWSGFNNFFSNVAHNPFPQSIPNLAKNVSEYLSNYQLFSSMNQQENGNPVIKYESLMDGSTASAPSTSMVSSRMQIRVLGVPQNGAKSRVETQIKLCLQLVTDDGDKAQRWSHLKLPEHMVAKDKLKRQQQITVHQDGSGALSGISGLENSSATVNADKMLFLSARVICASDPSRKVVTCLGCIQRERKRSQRRKESKVKSEYETDRLEDESLSLEEQKVLLFNCSEVVDFSSGDTILPTRITCYCRHHNEKIGFCIYFEMLDHHGKTVATGMSPPIMITDDHKSNKIKAGRKRQRTEMEKPVNTQAILSAAAAATSSSSSSPSDTHPTPSLNPFTNFSKAQAFFSSFSNNKSDTQHDQPQPPHPIDNDSYPLPMPLGLLKQQWLKLSSSDLVPKIERPQMQRMIPNEGPMEGGIEVTILGTGFRPGLTCLFGDVEATHTHYWSPNTLVCVLPPATQPGAVVVTFKEIPVVPDSQDLTLFTYCNESDRALMELALQVVGLKMTGKVEDARDVALRIVEGNDNSKQVVHQRQRQKQQQQQQPQQHAADPLSTLMSPFLASTMKQLLDTSSPAPLLQLLEPSFSLE
ncbi:hypothetical protein DM01DRAFT_1408472 [Hesseltinella vesiculosa]|uniref:IPT/TIG domain-containing protein n=1 Tax=Hesseltinella vesiculosa TaxID=101127 RepID=A0A1X2GEQ5_9FUNG|nr:hypothetical protein DM01DRAFT_1408472 [Hesseltinella vesiculosa]